MKQVCGMLLSENLVRLNTFPEQFHKTLYETEKKHKDGFIM